MSKVYEVDPEADTLVLVAASPSKAADTVVPSKRPRGDVTVVNGVDTSQPSDLRIKASSKHLSLASRPLRAKLAHEPTVQYDGRVHLRIEGHDPAAVTVVLNALHGKSSRVPKELDLDTVVRVAGFVHAFQCHEAVEAYAERWIARLLGKNGGGPSAVAAKYTPDTASWIFVAYVFRQPELFRAATRTAIARGPALQVGDKVPRIPERVTKAIEKKRQDLVGKVVGVIHSLVADLKNGTSSSCTQGCDLLLLGALIRALHQWNLSEPYAGVSFAGVAASLREVQDQVWYIGAPAPRNPNVAAAAAGGAGKTASTQPGGGERKDRFATHYCGIRSLINPQLYSLEVAVDGLDLDDVLDS